MATVTVPETMTGRAACRLLKCSNNQLLKFAALKKLRVVAPPGSPIRYVAEDVTKLVEELSRVK